MPDADKVYIPHVQQTLAAETLGLGSMYADFVMMANDYGGGHIAKHVSLPETHKIYGALLMGYPRLKFNKWPERNPAKVTWVNGATKQGEE